MFVAAPVPSGVNGVGTVSPRRRCNRSNSCFNAFSSFIALILARFKKRARARGTYNFLI